MIVSHHNKFIYSKAIKVYSTSTQLAFSKHCREGDIVTTIYPTHPNYTPRVLSSYRPDSHESLSNIKKYLGSQTFNSYSKIVSIRNTWDRLVTLYMFLKLQNMVPSHINSFSKFISNHDTEKFGLERYCCIDGELVCDFIIDSENTFKDVNHIENTLGLPITTDHIRLKEETFRTSHYSNFYTESTADQVYNLYRSEIDRFNFEYVGV
jgi:hypothetical protein